MSPKPTKPLPPSLTPTLRAACDKFFRLIADHGTFHRNQFIIYLNEQHRRPLMAFEVRDAFDYAAHCGAKSKGMLLQLPVKRRQPPPKGKRDKWSFDLFGGR